MKDNIVKVYRAVLTVKLSEDDKRGLDYRRSPEKILYKMRDTFNEMCDDVSKKTSATNFAEMLNKEIERHVAESVENKNTDITLLIDDIIEEVPDAICKADLEKAYEESKCDADLVLPDYIDAEILNATIHYEGMISHDMMRDFDGIYNTFKAADYLYNKGDDSFTMTFTLIQYEDGTVEDFHTPGCYNDIEA
jgi:hypothetical protein